MGKSFAMQYLKDIYSEEIFAAFLRYGRASYILSGNPTSNFRPKLKEDSS